MEDVKALSFVGQIRQFYSLEGWLDKNWLVATEKKSDDTKRIVIVSRFLLEDHITVEESIPLNNMVCFSQSNIYYLKENDELHHLVWDFENKQVISRNVKKLVLQDNLRVKALLCAFPDNSLFFELITAADQKIKYVRYITDCGVDGVYEGYSPRQGVQVSTRRNHIYLQQGEDVAIVVLSGHTRVFRTLLNNYMYSFGLL